MAAPLQKKKAQYCLRSINSVVLFDNVASTSNFKQNFSANHVLIQCVTFSESTQATLKVHISLCKVISHLHILIGMTIARA